MAAPDTLTGWYHYGDADRRRVAARRERPHRGRDLAVRRVGLLYGLGLRAADVRAALDRAEDGAVTCRLTPSHERMLILLRAAELADERSAQTAQVFSAEAGQDDHRGPGRGGTLRRPDPAGRVLGTQLYGDALPLDANRGTGLDKLGFTIHQPVGVVVAITPFNYPALLVMHKLAPALTPATRWCSSPPGPPR